MRDSIELEANPPATFLIESSPTPIYQRITKSYQQALEGKGHRVLYISPDQFNSFDNALHYFTDVVQSERIDYFLVFSNSVISKFYIEEVDRFVFELASGSIVFIHHDNFWGELANTNLLKGWCRVQQRSIHFCLEYKNFLDLREMGFEQVYTILHGSELKRVEPPCNYIHEVTFVGHVLPDFNSAFEQLKSLPQSYSIAADFWSRLVCLDKPIDSSATTYASQQGQTIEDAEFVSRKSAYYKWIGQLSPYLRGELFRHLAPGFNLALMGGDPGYLNNEAFDRRVTSPTITYYPPTPNYAEIREVYANSKINLNITSPQFDDAVVNRVIDVAAVGGFILTDWKAALSKLTTVSEQISYRTIEELNEKIAYYIAHEDERLEIAEQLHQDVIERCSYEQVVNFLLSRLDSMNNYRLSSQQEVVRVDLGCGKRKPEGFIGVDRYPDSNIDVVADLNQRFPFPSNSVDFIRAYDVVEHLHDRLHTMNEIWRVCKPDAQVDILVPSTDGRGAFQDPTHVSFWNINSFKYYCVEFPGYLELCRTYGFRGAFSIISLSHEELTSDQVIHVRAILKANKSAPALGKLSKQLNLRQINLIIFPDWSQPDGVLHPPLIALIRAISQHPDRQQITLLVNKGNFPDTAETNPEQLFYELAFNLFLSEEISIAEADLSISLIEDLTTAEAAELLQRITCRVPLPQEDLASARILQGENLPTCELATLAAGLSGWI